MVIIGMVIIQFVPQLDFIGSLADPEAKYTVSIFQFISDHHFIKPGIRSWSLLLRSIKPTLTKKRIDITALCFDKYRRSRTISYPWDHLRTTPLRSWFSNYSIECRWRLFTSIGAHHRSICFGYALLLLTRNRILKYFLFCWGNTRSTFQIYLACIIHSTFLWGCLLDQALRIFLSIRFSEILKWLRIHQWNQTIY